MKTIIVLFSLFLCSCAAANKANEYVRPDDYNCELTPSPTDTNKEDIVVLGDSISIGYTWFVKNDTNAFDVWHAPCNGRTSRFALTRLNQWLPKDHYKVITFNFGNHDITDTDVVIPTSEYQSNLKEICRRLLKKADHAIFFTTTDIPINVVGPKRGTVAQYNQLAEEALFDSGCPVYDLGAYALQYTDEHLDAAAQTNPHYTPQGYQHLADFVESAINTELEK
jgi:hypothetical protein